MSGPRGVRQERVAKRLFLNVCSSECVTAFVSFPLNEPAAWRSRSRTGNNSLCLPFSFHLVKLLYVWVKFNCWYLTSSFTLIHWLFFLTPTFKWQVPYCTLFMDQYLLMIKVLYRSHIVALLKPLYREIKCDHLCVTMFLQWSQTHNQYIRLLQIKIKLYWLKKKAQKE